MPTTDIAPETEYVLDGGIPYCYLSMVLGGISFVVLFLVRLLFILLGSHLGIRSGWFIIPLSIFLLGYFTSCRTIIRFDLLRRCYTLRRGLPVLSWARTGPFTDVRAICCHDNAPRRMQREINTCGYTWQFGGQSRWTIYIDWMESGRKKTVLIGSDSEFEVSDISGAVSNKLDIPYVWTGVDERGSTYEVTIKMFESEED